MHETRPDYFIARPSAHNNNRKRDNLNSKPFLQGMFSQNLTTSQRERKRTDGAKCGYCLEICKGRKGEGGDTCHKMADLHPVPVLNAVNCGVWWCQVPMAWPTPETSWRHVLGMKIEMSAVTLWSASTMDICLLPSRYTPPLYLLLRS